MSSSGERLVTGSGGGDGVRATVASTGSLEQVHRRQHFVFRVLLRAARKEHARAADHNHDEHGRDARI